VRGLSIPPPHQLSLHWGEQDQPIATVWEVLSIQAQERALRILAQAIARVLSAEEGDDR
jgi:hypothetical protein